LNRLSVSFQFSPKSVLPVGRLALDNRRLFFEYDKHFLEKGFWLSPYKLPLQTEVFEYKDDNHFGPIFGLFDDSLPDGWGLLLMDRYLKKRGYDTNTLTMLDRLSFLGNNTMGALVYEPVLDIEASDNTPFDLHNLSKQAMDIISGKTDEVLPQMIKAGGSPGGARPKVLVGVSGDTLISGETDLPDDFEHWIIKFSDDIDSPQAGIVEYIYSLLARDTGMHMPETRLFGSKEQGYYFGVKRFDRLSNQRFHVHTFGNLIHSNFRIPSQDYDDLLRLTKDLTKNYQCQLSIVRQMVFNIIFNNRDDHVKNFAFIMDHNGEWSLSPAYDITFSVGPNGEHTMTIMGEGKAPTIRDVYKVCDKHSIKQKEIDAIIGQVIDATNKFPFYAEQYSLSTPIRKEIASRIQGNVSLFIH